MRRARDSLSATFRLASEGGVAWFVYGLTERALASSYYRLMDRAYAYCPPAAAAAIGLLLFYSLCGAVSAGCAQLVSRKETIARCAYQLTLLFLFVIGLVREYIAPSYGDGALHVNASYAVALSVQMALLAIMLLAAARHPLVAVRSLTLSLLLVLPWFLLQVMATEPRVIKGGIAAGSFFGVAAGGMGINFSRMHWSRTRTSMRWAAWTTVALVGATAVWGIVETPPVRDRLRDDAPSGRLPSVILITLDTTAAGHTSLGPYIRDTTPGLAMFAKDAWLFSRAYASSNNTLATHASIFTGLDPTEHGSYHSSAYPEGRPLSSHVPTLPAILRSSGYVTAAVVANYGYLGYSFGLDRGFDYLDQRCENTGLSAMPAYSIGETVRYGLASIAPLSALERVTRPAGQITDSAIGVLTRLTRRRQPFFLFLNYMDAHWPYVPPDSYARRFGVSTPWMTTADYLSLHRSATQAKKISDAAQSELIGRYDAAVLYLDREVSKLIAYLYSSHVIDRAVVIITSDHGEAFGLHTYLGHHSSLYDDQVAIPLIIRFPGARQGLTSDFLTSSVDLFSTVLKVAGVKIPPVSVGRPLDDPSAVNRPVLLEHFESDGTNRRALIDGYRKLIVWENGRVELYDLAHDPDELVDLAPISSSHDLMNEYRHLTGGLRLRVGRDDPAAVDREALRSLGYLR